MGLAIGVLGADHPHAGGHLAALNAAPEIERLVFWEADAALRAQVTANYPALIVKPAEDILADPAIAAVCVLAPDVLAGPLTVQALRAGKWVYADKPGAHDLLGLQTICDTAQAVGAHYCPCYCHRNTPAARTLCSLVQGGALGRVWSCTAQWMTSQIALRGPEHWLFHRDHSAGGILTWLACHWLDLLRVVLASEVTEVTARLGRQTEETVDVEDVAALILRFANGVEGVVRAGYVLRPFGQYADTDLYLQFEGGEGSVTYCPHSASPLRLRSAHPNYAHWEAGVEDLEWPEGAKRDGYGGEFLAQFLAAVNGQGDPPATELDALAVMRTIDAAYRSAAENRMICLN